MTADSSLAREISRKRNAVHERRDSGTFDLSCSDGFSPNNCEIQCRLHALSLLIVKNPLPRIRMVDGFNEGWIDFESGQSGSRKSGTML